MERRGDMSAVDEADVLTLGKALLAAARQSSPRVYRGLNGQALKACLEDADLRAALFRFIDALPQLHDSAARAAHLNEYLAQIPGKGTLSRLMKMAARPALAWLIVMQVRRMARNFLVEEDARAFSRLQRSLATVPAAISIDAVGEAVLSETEADRYRDRVLWQLMQDWPQQHAPHLSIKLTALTSAFDPLDAAGTRKRVFARLEPIVIAAAERGATITVDMEHYEVKEQILALFFDMLDHFDFATPTLRWCPAIALQAYLPESGADLRRILDAAQRHGRKLGVRLVKGAYWDQENAWSQQRGWPMPCYCDKSATDAHYEALTAELLSHTDSLLPAIASHNPRSLAVAVAQARQRALGPDQWEVQMLYGMAEPLRDALAARQVPLRIYVPSGDLVGGMAYLIRRLLENTAGTSVLRQTWLNPDADDILLQKPVCEPAAMQSCFPPTHPNVALSDFSQARVRNEFSHALESQRRHLCIAAPPSLENDAGTYLSRNPHDPTQILGISAITPLHDIDAVVTAAQAAQKTWAQRPAVARVELLLSLARDIETRRHEFAATQVLEAGKPWREADADVAEAIDFLRYYSAQMLALDGAHTTHAFPGQSNYYRYAPRGVAVAIAPWNFPLAILTGMTAAALVTGNAALMKPALPALQSAHMLRAAMRSVGLPEALCPLLVGDVELGQRLVAHPGVHLIAFTGSRQAGLDILQHAHTMQPAQQHVKQVVCEMGGKNAIIVDADADLDEAVSGILASAFGYSGQKCSACSRIIAVESIAEALQERLVSAAATLRWGDPSDPACDHGPLINAAAQQKALRYLEIGKLEARLAWQGAVPTTGWHCPPTIFGGVQPTHRIAREEIFGPILALMTAPDFSRALQIANDSDYALTGGVYSRLPSHLTKAEEEFHVGNLYLNRSITGARVGIQPFGGVRLSGTGVQAGGPDYLKQFMWMQSVSQNSMRKGFVPDN